MPSSSRLGNALPAWALGAALLAACSAPAPPPQPPEPITTAEPIPSASATTTPPATAPAVTDFGVAECDTYVKKYLECVEGRVSGEAKDKLLETFEANRTKWRAMSTMREAAVALGIACKAAAIKAKEELSVEYGCEF